LTPIEQLDLDTVVFSFALKFMFRIKEKQLRFIRNCLIFKRWSH